MTLKRVITEFGTGNDLHGGDYTKAAVRAVQDAIHHSSLTLIRTLGVDAKTMQVEVTVGVQQPARVDLAAVKAALPHGEVKVNAVKGGLDVPDDDGRDTAIIATAAVTVRIDLGKERIEVLAGSHQIIIDDFRSAVADGRILWKGRADKGHRAHAAAFLQAVQQAAQRPDLLRCQLSDAVHAVGIAHGRLAAGGVLHPP